MIDHLAPDHVRRAATAAATSDAAPFVFHDAAGRRWSRIKRIAVAVAAAMIALAGAVLLAVTHVAPGRAPLFSTAAAPRVPDWPLRDSGSAPSAPAAATGPAGPGTGAGAAQPQPTAARAATPRSSGLKPTPQPEHSPRPRRPRPSASPF